MSACFTLTIDLVLSIMHGDMSDGHSVHLLVLGQQELAVKPHLYQTVINYIL